MSSLGNWFKVIHSVIHSPFLALMCLLFKDDSANNLTHFEPQRAFCHWKQQHFWQTFGRLSHVPLLTLEDFHIAIQVSGHDLYMYCCPFGTFPCISHTVSVSFWVTSNDTLWSLKTLWLLCSSSLCELAPRKEEWFIFKALFNLCADTAPESWLITTILCVSLLLPEVL